MALSLAPPARADMVGHGAMVNSVAVSADGKQVLSGSWDYTVKLWDLASQKEIRTFDGHVASVNAVLFGPDGKTALSGSWDHKIIRWDLATGKQVADLRGPRQQRLGPGAQPRRQDAGLGELGPHGQALGPGERQAPARRSRATRPTSCR